MTERQQRVAAPVLLPDVDIEGTRLRLLEAAIELFAEYGYHGVTVKEIAEKAGIQAGSVYVHFPSKEQVLYELMKIGHIEHRDRLRDAVAQSADPIDQVRAIVKANVWVHATYPLVASIGQRDLSALSPASLESILAIRHESEQILLDAVERGERAGVFSYPKLWLCVAAIGAMGMRVAAWYRPGHEFAALYSVDEVAEAYADFAIRTLT
jgi:AcrR family transcriptional regulator